MEHSTQERRKFSRVVLDWPVEIHHQDKSWPALLVDLSFRGVLLNCENMSLDQDAKVHLHIHIPQSLLDLDLVAHVVRSCGPIYALRLDAMGIDSMSEVRRVIELNLGDDSLLQREMEQLLEIR